MRTEIRTKTINYNVYIAKDGKEFNDEDKCKHHEMILDGTRIVCPKCHGEGRVVEEIEYDNYHTEAPEIMKIYPKCSKCNSKGYLEKKETWE